MKKTIELLGKGFESSTVATPEFNSFVRTFKRELKKEITKIGGRDIVFRKGHFFVSGFFTGSNNQIYYFSLTDVRDNPSNLLVRTAENYKDYTGGQNHWVNIKEDMFENVYRMVR